LPVEEWKYEIENEFEDSAFSKYPVIADLKRTLYDHGAIYASMSGSGASVYGLFRDKIAISGLEKENQVYYDL
ncbi:MAG: 4-(cytidine 5-diphospho)-2-C-methyl-D-erythritol kinase, partial [Daejeonella sp.]|nr:4-(cytidine 5-diphospho)-2-C-methyl-D-erythritol kinase [Daejeonella sp.]